MQPRKRQLFLGKREEDNGSRLRELESEVLIKDLVVIPDGVLGVWVNSRALHTYTRV